MGLCPGRLSGEWDPALTSGSPWFRSTRRWLCGHGRAHALSERQPLAAKRLKALRSFPFLQADSEVSLLEIREE